MASFVDRENLKQTSKIKQMETIKQIERIKPMGKIEQMEIKQILNKTNGRWKKNPEQTSNIKQHILVTFDPQSVIYTIFRTSPPTPCGEVGGS